MKLSVRWICSLVVSSSRMCLLLPTSIAMRLEASVAGRCNPTTPIVVVIWEIFANISHSRNLNPRPGGCCLWPGHWFIAAASVYSFTYICVCTWIPEIRNFPLSLSLVTVSNVRKVKLAFIIHRLRVNRMQTTTICKFAWLWRIPWTYFVFQHSIQWQLYSIVS